MFPQYLDVFSDVTGSTSMMILQNYPTPDRILRAHKDSLIEKISKASRKGIKKATEKYEKLVLAASFSKVFSCDLDNVYFNISTTLTLIKGTDDAVSATMDKSGFGKNKPAGKFNATQVHMSKRGSRIARRAIFSAALACIRKKRNGEAINPYLYDYYQKKTAAKPKIVALGAVMQKSAITSLLFSVMKQSFRSVHRKITV